MTLRYLNFIHLDFQKYKWFLDLFLGVWPILFFLDQFMSVLSNFDILADFDLFRPNRSVLSFLLFLDQFMSVLSNFVYWPILICLDQFRSVLSNFVYWPI